MHLNKKYTVILFVLFILSFGLSFAFLEYKDAKTNTSKTLGVEMLADADYYETISDHKPGNIKPSELEIPKITKNLESPINGFSIKTSQREIFGNIYVDVKFEDGSYSDKLVVLESDARAEEDPADIFFSDLFTFSQKISEINAYYNGDYQFEILIVDNQAQDNIGLGDSVTADASAFYSTEAAELEYKEKFLNAINLNIIPREDWGAPTISMWENPLVYDADRIVVHHTATGVDADPAVTVKAIYNDHAYNRGWLDIGYNYLIAPNGAIYEGRAGGNGVRGAHAIPNSNTIGISMLGNYQDQQPTTAAISSLQKLMGVLAKFNDIDMVYRSGTYAPSADRPSGVYPHATYNSDYPTACPGQSLRNIMPQIVENAKAYKSFRPQVSATADEATKLTSNREMQRDGAYVEVMVDTTGLSTLMKEKLKTESRGVTSYRELGDTIIYKVEEDKVKQVVAETKLVAPTTKAQPNFIYKTSEGWVDDGTNAYPDNTAPDNDYDASVHWNLEKINMPEAWHELGGCTAVDDNTCGGNSSVVIAVLDTGVAYEDHNYDAGTDYYTTKIGGLHIEIPATNPGGGGYTPTYNEGYDRQYYQSPELNNSKFVHPYDAAQEYLCALRASDGNTSTDCNTTELAKRYRANDDHGHGTFVTSIIAANVDDTGRNLVTGMAHNVNIMPIKVFLPNDRSMCQDGSGNLDETCSNSYYDYRTVATSYTLVRGIEHAVDNGADVINMSLTGLGSDPYVEAAIDEATAANTIVVAAAGNYDSDIANYFPASFENVIAVGATDEGDNKASYSNYGNALDIVAPVGDSGQIIASHTYSCYPSKNNCSDETNPNIFQSFYDVNEDDGNTMAKNIGTSFAAPQVAAAVGLAKGISPNLTFNQIYNILQTTNTKVDGIDSSLSKGYGMLNMQYLLNYINDVINTSSNPNTNPSPNADNKTDLIAFNFENKKIDVTISDGTSFGGGYGNPQVWNSNTAYSTDDWTLLKPADVNGDGRIDIIAFNKRTTQVDVTLATNNGNYGYGYKGYQVWNSKTFYSTKDWTMLDPADVDGDGKADLIAYNFITSAVDVTLSDGATFGGGYGNAQVWNSKTFYSTKDWKMLSPSDVDGDGDADIVAFNFVTSAVDVTLSDSSSFGGGYGNAQVWNSKTFYSTKDWEMLRPSDVDGDGDADLVAFNFITSAVDVTLSDGSSFGGGYGNPQVWNSKTFYSTKDWEILDPADVDGDGDTDILAFNFITSAVDVTLSDGNSFGGGYGNPQVWNSKTFYSTKDWTLLN